MNVLLLGHKGYVGSFLYENLDVDILEDRNVYYNGNKYNYIINCIGKADLEYCEKNILDTDYSNMNVILDIQKKYPNSKIINFSSYYVYDFESICDENSTVTYEYNYTRQKLFSEKYNQNGVTFRVGKIFGHEDILKQNKLTEHIIKNSELNLDSINFNPTSLEQILNVIKYDIENNALFGVYNLANDGFSNHYEYGVFINDILGSNKKINKVSNIGKTFHNYGKFTMSCDKLKKHIELAKWEDDMIKYLEKIK